VLALDFAVESTAGPTAASAATLIAADAGGAIRVWRAAGGAAAERAAGYALLRELRPPLLRGVPIVAARLRPGAPHQALLLAHPELTRPPTAAEAAEDAWVARLTEELRGVLRASVAEHWPDAPVAAGPGKDRVPRMALELARGVAAAVDQQHELAGLADATKDLLPRKFRGRDVEIRHALRMAPPLIILRGIVHEENALCVDRAPHRIHGVRNHNARVEDKETLLGLRIGQ
jgi:hypothetical protein